MWVSVKMKGRGLPVVESLGAFASGVLLSLATRPFAEADEMQSAFIGIHVTGEVALGDLLVAIGTALLAIFTWNLARSTSKSVSEAEGQIEISNRALEAQTLPSIIPTPPLRRVIYGTGGDGEFVHIHFYRQDGDGDAKLAVRLWNIGKGAALIHRIELSVADGPELVGDLETEILAHPGGTPDEKVHLPLNEIPVCIPGALATMRVYYRDVAGVEYFTSSDLAVLEDNNLLRKNARQVRVELDDPA